MLKIEICLFKFVVIHFTTYVVSSFSIKILT